MQRANKEEKGQIRKRKGKAGRERANKAEKGQIRKGRGKA